MPLKVLIAPDKFKGTLTASKAAAAIARGWQKVRPQDTLELLPISDGGDGFGETLGLLLNAKPQSVKTVDAAHSPCKALWWWEPKTRTALIESANVIGLAMLPRGKFHPFALDTFGLGKVIRAALSHKPKYCLIGIGGSATNDGGFGVAQALGWKFLDRVGQTIEHWTELHRLVDIQHPREKLPSIPFTVAVDVQNPLLGKRGATHIYGPQKGLKPSEFAKAERNLRRLAAICRREGLSETSAFAGAGAAGGLGFGLKTFLAAELQPGFELFAQFAKLHRRLRSVDLVITGEGRLDRSTAMGKGVGQLAICCREAKVPCIALAGEIDSMASIHRLFAKAYALTELTSATSAQAKAAHWLERLAQSVATNLKEPIPFPLRGTNGKKIGGMGI